MRRGSGGSRETRTGCLRAACEPRSERHDLEEGFPPWFPASRLEEKTKAEILTHITHQGLGFQRRRGARGTRSCGWSDRGSGPEQYEYEYGVTR